MNNIFYRLAPHLEPQIQHHGRAAADEWTPEPWCDEVDFELWSLAVSAINGCGKCVDAHEKVVREMGGGEELVLAVIRVASVLHAIGDVPDAVQAQALIHDNEPETVMA